MAVKLRLKRVGRKNRPYYRITAMDARRPRHGREIEVIGVYDPLVDDENRRVRINKERAEYWLSVGAEPSETVRSFLRKHQVSGLIRPRKRRRKKSSRGAPGSDSEA